KLAVLDGNVARVLARLQAIRGNLRAGKRWQELQKSAEALLAPRAPGDWNQAIMEKRKKHATVELQLVAAVLLDSQGHTLLLPPPKPKTGPAHKADVGALVSRLWHFPTIGVHRDAALDLRAYLEESLLRGHKFSAPLERLPKIRHTVTYRSI